MSKTYKPTLKTKDKEANRNKIIKFNAEADDLIEEYKHLYNFK